MATAPVPATIHGRLLDVAASCPDRVAIVHDDARTGFRELASRARRAAQLVADRTRPGDRVAVVGANHPVWLDLYFGVPGAGRMLTLLNHRLAGTELVDQLARSGASLLIGDAAALERIGTGDARPVITTLSFAEWASAVDSAPEAALVDEPGPAWIIFTSGTTARPKGAVLSHASLLAAVDATDTARPIEADAVYVFPFPLCHVAGYNVVHHLLAGRPVVLLDRFTPDSFVRTVDGNAATSASLAATMLHDLLDYIEETGTIGRLRTLRSISYGAAPMPTALLRRAHAMLAVDFWQGYGMTELSGNAVFLPPSAHERGLAGDERVLGAAGWPAPGVELRIVDGTLRDLEAGDPGEILVRAPQAFDGYWNDPEATASTVVDGWLRTGDVGMVDATGLLRIVDRVKDVIVTGGENVSSLEVEEAVRAAAGVRDAAVVGLPDRRWGEAVCAIIVPEPAATLDHAQITAAVRRVLAGFKVPRHILERADLPRNAAGKVMKADLRAWAAAAVTAREEG